MSTNIPPVPANNVNKPEFSYPVLPFAKYNNNSGKFLDPLYYKQLRAEHPGADLNKNTGGNTDWGDPIYAIADGIVEAAKFYPTWGNIILIYHPKHGIWSQYAHLQLMHVKVGDRVTCQQKIGTLGRGAQNRYLAHLHFEIRYKKVAPDYWPTAYHPNRWVAQSDIKNKYVNPMNYLSAKKAATVLV